MDKKILARFFCKVLKSPDDNCWQWAASKNKAGYGYFGMNNKAFYAHRISWVIHNGINIPDGLCVCHSCDNPSCVNPDHLFLGSYQENSTDMVVKGRVASGERSSGAKLTQAEVDSIRVKHAGGGWTQMELANRYHVTQATVSKIVRNETWVTT